METKPSFFKKNSMLKLKSNFLANIQYNKAEAFGWKVREKISEAIDSIKTVKTTQNMSNKEKQPYKSYACEKHQNNH